MFDVNILADNIKKHRLKIGLDQDELAESLYISTRVVSEWEQAISVPDIRNLCALAELFGVSVNELLANKYNRETVMIGVDGGGTKTEFVLFTESGSIKRRIDDVKDLLLLLDLTGYLKIFEKNSRPKFKINSENEKLLEAFCKKKLIDNYEENPEKAGYYKIIKHKHAAKALTNEPL